MDDVAEHLRGLSGYNDKGEELPDSKPVALPIGFTRPKSLKETMEHLMRNEEFRRELASREIDTFDEADDFEIEDDEDPMRGNTPYESDFDPHHVAAREQEIRSGFVEEIPLEKKEKSRYIVDEHRRKATKTGSAKGKAKPDPKASDSGPSDDED